MRSTAGWGICILLGLSVFFGGCMRPRLAVRGLSEHESGWAQTIKRSYPGWRSPYLTPVRGGYRSSQRGTDPYDSRAAVVAPPEATFVQEARPALVEAEIELIPVDGGDSSLTNSGKTYIVKQGDTLRSISAKRLGDEKHWEKLLKHNHRVLSNPNQLRPGMVLELPAF